MKWTKEAREFLNFIADEYESARKEKVPELREQKMKTLKAKVDAFIAYQRSEKKAVA